MTDITNQIPGNGPNQAIQPASVIHVGMSGEDFGAALAFLATTPDSTQIDTSAIDGQSEIPAAYNQITAPSDSTVVGLPDNLAPDHGITTISDFDRHVTALLGMIGPDGQIVQDPTLRRVQYEFLLRGAGGVYCRVRPNSTNWRGAGN